MISNTYSAFAVGGLLSRRTKSPFFILNMPPRTRSNRPQQSTRKRQASNVDETANKRPKTEDNESKVKKSKKKPKKSKRYFFFFETYKNELTNITFFFTGILGLPKA
jgi:hypothetical protein